MPEGETKTFVGISRIVAHGDTELSSIDYLRSVLSSLIIIVLVLRGSMLLLWT